jgi:hypothetical protein
MSHELIDDLRAEIAKGHVLVVVGTGVSLAAACEAPDTSVASWTGLLLNGVERCANCIQGLGDLALQRSDPETAGARFTEALGLY